tara:strand:+ start:6 stop:1136 length:1131 start_codon:yes stop_codon:yes gene_type:complete
MNKKSISIVSNNFWTIYKFRYDIVKLLIQNGYHINLLAGEDSYIEKFDNPNITTVKIPINDRGMNLIQEINTFRKIYVIHKKLRPDLVFNFTLKPNIYSSFVCRYLNIPFISMITGLGHVFISDRNILKKLITFLLLHSLKKSLEVWFTNKSDKAYFQENKIVSNQHIKIIPGAGAIIPDVEAEYKHYNNSITFVMIARLLKEKGVEEYLSTATQFNTIFKNDKDRKNIKFILIGSHKNDSNYVSKRLIENLNKTNIIQYEKYTDRITDVLEKANCIILPSYREGMSTVLLEAAVLKIPIITSSVPGCIDIVPDESYGTLCKPANTASLLNAICRFLKLDEETLRSQTLKTYNHVKNNHNRHKVFEAYKQTLKYIE